MTYAVVAVVAITWGVIAHKALTRTQPQPRCPESYWHGYRRGYDDGVVTTVHHERTPSLN